MEFIKHDLQVTKTNPQTKKREPVGSVAMVIPSLLALIPSADQVKDNDKPVYNDDGLPVFTDERYNWLQEAITAKAKAQVRNKLESGSINLVSGAVIPTSWAEFTAEGGGNTAQHLAVIREAKALFAKWVTSLGKSAQAVAMITGAFNSPSTLVTSDAGYKAKIVGYLEDFIDSISPEDFAKYEKYITKVTEAASSEVTEADDF